MAKLNLYIFNDNGQTRTQIGNEKGLILRNAIVFHNKDSNAGLTVDFDIDMDTSALNKRTISVPAGDNKTVKFKKGDGKGTKVKYKAKIAGATLEDPIIIID